jgi:hypothetical protein
VDSIRAEIEALVDQSEPIDLSLRQQNSPAKPRETRIERFQPFPVDVFPEPVKTYVAKSAGAIGCDPTYIALPLLAALGAAIGTTRMIRLKRTWTEYPIIWAVIVGESGTLKTPALRHVLKPFQLRQFEALKRYQEEKEVFDRELLQYDKDFLDWQKHKANLGPPEKPQSPLPVRHIVSDITLEAIAPILAANPRGILATHDELSGWIGSFDRYAGRKGGADAAHWMSMHSGEPIVVDRKGEPRTIVVPSAAVSVCGGIQPVILHRAIGSEHRESGLLARLLLANPPRRPKRWSDVELPESAEADLDRIIDGLYGLQHDQTEGGAVRPHTVTLTPRAKQELITFYNEHGQETANLTGHLASAWSKLEGYAARLALIVHLIGCANGDPTLEGPDLLDERSIEAGVTLSRWFCQEARRVYAAFEESEEVREQRNLIEWIEGKGGAVSVRDLTHGLQLFPGNSDAAESALKDLAQAGYGRLTYPKPGSQGGRPSTRFELSSDVSNSETPDSDGISLGFGDGDSSDIPEAVLSGNTPTPVNMPMTRTSEGDDSEIEVGIPDGPEQTIANDRDSHLRNRGESASAADGQMTDDEWGEI